MPVKHIEDQNSTIATHSANVSTYVTSVEAGQQVLQISTSVDRQGSSRDYVTVIYYSGPTIP